MLHLRLAILALSAVTSARATNRTLPYLFQPDDSVGIPDPSLPLFDNNVTSLQLDPAWDVESWWINSYVTTVDYHQFFLISHAIFFNGAPSVVKSALLQIDEPDKYYHNLSSVPRPSSYATDGKFLVQGPGFIQRALTADSFSTINTAVETENYGFNLTLNATSSPLLDFGGNAFSFGDGQTVEWSFPACRTSGNVSFQGRDVGIDPDKSFTWYDRQVNNGTPSVGWVWFEIHLERSDIKASVWSIQKTAEEYENFATIRSPSGNNLTPVSVKAHANETWHSSFSNVTYGLAWSLSFPNGDWLELRSQKDDQEIAGIASVPASNAYEGFMTGHGSFMGVHHVYGLVEQTRFS